MEGEGETEQELQVSQQPEQKPGMSRRDFLKTVVKSAVVVGANEALGPMGGMLAKAATERFVRQEQTPTPETERQFHPSSVYLDLGSADTTNRDRIMQAVLGNSNRSEQLSLDSEEYNQNFGNYISSTDTDVVKTAMIAEILRTRLGHGELVNHVYKNTLRDFGHVSLETQMLPLERAINYRFVDNPQENPLRNPMAEVIVDEKIVGDMLDTYFSDNPETDIVSMSFQVGRQRREYQLYEVPDLPKYPYLDGTGQEFLTTEEFRGTMMTQDNRVVPYRISEDGGRVEVPTMTQSEYESLNEQHRQQFEQRLSQLSLEQVRSTDGLIRANNENRVDTESYNSEFARKNLLRLTALAERFPDKLFLAAGGNYHNDFYSVRQSLEEEFRQQGKQWPENLVMVGVEFGEGVVEADGCDIYIHSSEFRDITGETYTGSSQATAVVRGVADHIASTLSPELSSIEQMREIKRQLLSNQYSVEGRYRGLEEYGDAPTYDERTTRQARFLHATARG